MNIKPLYPKAISSFQRWALPEVTMSEVNNVIIKLCHFFILFFYIMGGGVV